jgi:hypothetical protein
VGRLHGALACAALAVLCATLGTGGCAGALEDPSRFVYLLEDGGALAVDSGDADAGDGGPGDAGSADGGDAGPADAGDAGASDAGDAGPRDGGSDAGPRDGGLDAGTHDAGPPDAGCNPVTLFFGPTCATGLCHSADIQQASLDLASPGMPGRLVGKASNGYPGLLLIDPAHPDNSLMFTKTTANPPGNGFQMPLALDPLTDVEAACLLEWVRNAAAQ